MSPGTVPTQSGLLCVPTTRSLAVLKHTPGSGSNWCRGFRGSQRAAVVLVELHEQVLNASQVRHADNAEAHQHGE